MIHLRRIVSTKVYTFGVLVDGDEPFALTMEPGWNDNLPDISCIPEGSYRCERVQSPRFGETFEITNVPGRTHILFHKGNWAEDTKGCVLVGEQFETSGGRVGVMASHKGYTELLRRLDDQDEFELKIWRPNDGKAD